MILTPTTNKTMFENPDEKTFQEILIDFFKKNLYYQHKKDSKLFEENLREDSKNFLLKPILKKSLKKINSHKTEGQIDTTIFEIEKITNPDLILANKQFYQLVKNGIDTFNEKKNIYEKVFLFDRENYANNDFLIVDEFKFQGSKSKRVDVVIFVNGIPVVVIELKNPLAEKETIDKAFIQIKNYQQDIKDLFITNCFNVISNDFINGAGTLTSNLERYNEFKDKNGKQSFANHFSGLFSKQNLIKIIFDYLVFTKENKKILASYHQFFAVEKIMQKSILANQNKKNQVGVIWHTTGSGKSLTMVFYTKQLLEKLKPLVIVLTDRIDLDDQLFTTFSYTADFLGVNQGLKKIKSRNDLVNTLNQNTKSEIIFTTIQKFLKDEDKLKFDKLSNREDVFIIVDEAHRSQYDIKDGLARHLRDALPNAKFLGFSGTPIELENKNTKLIFGDYLDKYVMSRAVKDKTTVPINYEPRLAKIGLKKEMIPTLDKKANEIFSLAGISEKKEKEFLKMEAIVGNKKRLQLVAKDFLDHHEKRQQNIKGKVMFCCISRDVAVKFYDILKELKPELFDDDDD